MRKVKNQELYPTLLHQFKVDNPAMRVTVRCICAAGFTLHEVLRALAEDAPHRFTAGGSKSRAPSGFLPDYGVLFAKLAPLNCVLTTDFEVFDLFARTSTGCLSTTVHVELGSVTFARTFDFTDAVFTSMLDAFNIDAGMRVAISRVRPCELFTLPLVAQLTAIVGPEANTGKERFRPFVVTSATVSNVELIIL